MDRKQLGRYGCSGSTVTDTNQFAFVVTMGLFMSVGLTFATSIISIGLKLFYAAILRALEQSIAITITLLLFHTYSRSRSYSCFRRRGKVRLREPMGASSHFGKRVTRSYLASLMVTG